VTPLLRGPGGWRGGSLRRRKKAVLEGRTWVALGRGRTYLQEAISVEDTRASDKKSSQDKEVQPFYGGSWRSPTMQQKSTQNLGGNYAGTTQKERKKPQGKKAPFYKCQESGNEKPQ